MLLDRSERVQPDRDRDGPGRLAEQAVRIRRLLQARKNVKHFLKTAKYF
jgi:hypothetical protein